MNDSKFDEALRASMPALDVPDSLDARVEARLIHFHSKRRSIRRYAMVGGLLAVIGASGLLLPTRADAVLQRIAGALDDVEHVRMTRYTVLDDGTRKARAATIYSLGMWRMDDGERDHQIYKQGKLFTYDKFLNVYRELARPDGPFGHNMNGIRLSSLLKASGMGADTKVEVKNGELRGKQVMVATKSNELERITIYADEESERPIEAHIAGSVGGWKTSEVITFDYPFATPSDSFQLMTGVRIVADEEATNMKVKELTRGNLAERPTREGRFVLRKVDVAADGTVFVTYQAGDRGTSYRGFRLSISDDLGTSYAAPRERYYRPDSLRSKDGRIDQEIFVPLTPVASWRARKLVVSGHFVDDKMVRFAYGFSKYPDGTWEFKKFPNNLGTNPAALPKATEIWSKAFASPTCEWHPHYMPLTDYMSFATDLRSKIFRADHLAQRSLNFSEFPVAADWLQKAIALKHEANRAGDGPFATTEQEQQLESIRAGEMRQPPALR